MNFLHLRQLRNALFSMELSEFLKLQLILEGKGTNLCAHVEGNFLIKFITSVMVLSYSAISLTCLLTSSVSNTPIPVSKLLINFSRDSLICIGSSSSLFMPCNFYKRTFSLSNFNLIKTFSSSRLFYPSHHAYN